MIMGKTTFESILNYTNGNTPLPGRLSLVLCD